MVAQGLVVVGVLFLFAGCAETSKVASSGQAMSGHSSASQMTAQPTRRSVGLDGVTLSLLEAGTGDPVIYIHGV